MSEALSMPEAGEGIAQPTAGMLLRQAREAAGLHVATLAVSLKVPVRKLEALEQDRYDELPDAVFARALASSVCRTLKIDAQPILERLPQGKARLRADDGINTPFRAPGDRPPPGVVDQLTRPVGLAVAALLLGAVVIMFLPTLRYDDAPVAPKPATVAPSGLSDAGPAQPGASAPAMVVESAASAPVVADGTAAPASAPLAAGVAASPAAAATAATATATAPAAAPAASAAAPAARPAASAASAAARGASSAGTSVTATQSATVAFVPPSSDVVAFRTRAASWVQVTDAKGAVVMQRLMNAGDTASAGGALPLTVTVGNVTATEVQVRGKAQDLRAQARDNVARFQVK